MPCVEGERSDCQPEASSITRSRKIVFITSKVYHSLTLFIFVLKMERIEHELVHGFSNNYLP